MALLRNVYYCIIALGCTYIMQVILMHINHFHEHLDVRDRQENMVRPIIDSQQSQGNAPSNLNKSQKLDSIPRRNNANNTKPELWPDISRVSVNKNIKYPMSGSPFHKYWNVNCTDIINGKNVHDVFIMMNGHRDSDKNLQVPTDIEVASWFKNCHEYKNLRRVPTAPFSAEEADFPIAYIITTHTEAAQVERLLRAIYQPQNVYCIHPDAKSSQSFHDAIKGLVECFDNVFVASKLENVQYAGYTRLLADVNCMKDLLRRPEQWKYVLNMCAQDFPLKTNFEIVQQLIAYKGHSDINGILPPSYIKPRTEYVYKTSIDTNKIFITGIKKHSPPHRLTIYFGNAYYGVTRAFVDFVINDPIAIDLLKWSNDTFSPDEHYWVTLHRAKGTPGGGYPNGTWDSNVRFMKWGDIPKHPPCKGKYVRALCVFGVGYMKYLTRQPQLFANKFMYGYDPVTLQCLEELLDYRIVYPETANVFPNFPVLDMVWQNYTAT